MVKDIEIAILLIKNERISSNIPSLSLKAPHTQPKPQIKNENTNGYRRPILFIEICKIDDG